MRVTEAQYDAIADHADVVAKETWAKLVGQDCTAAIIVIGTLLAAVERALGWPREEVLLEVFDIADCCVPDDWEDA